MEPQMEDEGPIDARQRGHSLSLRSHVAAARTEATTGCGCSIAWKTGRSEAVATAKEKTWTQAREAARPFPFGGGGRRSSLPAPFVSFSRVERTNKLRRGPNGIPALPLRAER